MRQFRLVQLSVAILALLTFVRPMPASEQRSAAGLAARPNIVFILADDLGYGDLSCYGQTQFRTPNIDRLAAQGARFTNFYAGSTVCAPSRCVLMTGLHTGHCTIRGNGSVNLRPEDVTVAEVLGRAGYRTGLIGKWGLGAENSTGIPTRKGFDRFFGYLDQTHAHNYYPTFLYSDDKRVQLQNVVPKEGRMGQGVATKRIDYSPDLMTREALAFIENNRDRPFFLYFACTMPHANNEAGKQGMEVPGLGVFGDRPWPEPQKRLAAMITHLDNDVG
jgi:arylsulfatase A-like enzyme